MNESVIHSCLLSFLHHSFHFIAFIPSITSSLCIFFLVLLLPSIIFPSIHYSFIPYSFIYSFSSSFLLSFPSVFLSSIFPLFLRSADHSYIFDGDTVEDRLNLSYAGIRVLKLLREFLELPLNRRQQFVLEGLSLVQWTKARGKDETKDEIGSRPPCLHVDRHTHQLKTRHHIA